MAMVPFKEFQRRLKRLEEILADSQTFEDLVEKTAKEPDFFSVEEVVTGDCAQVTKPLRFFGRDLPEMPGYEAIKQRAVTFVASNRKQFEREFGEYADSALSRVAKVLDTLDDIEFKEL